MQCAESVRAQAYFDRELASPSAVDIERHAQHCLKCCKLLVDLMQMRCVLRRDLAYMSIPAAMKVRVIRALNRESRIGITPVYARDLRAWLARPFWQAWDELLGLVKLIQDLIAGNG